MRADGRGPRKRWPAWRFGCSAHGAPQKRSPLAASWLTRVIHRARPPAAMCYTDLSSRQPGDLRHVSTPGRHNPDVGINMGGDVVVEPATFSIQASTIAARSQRKLGDRPAHRPVPNLGRPSRPERRDPRDRTRALRPRRAHARKPRRAPAHQRARQGPIPRSPRAVRRTLATLIVLADATQSAIAAT